jgi:AcrR family transcriptional regulator
VNEDTAQTRPYKGRSPDERKAERRRRLIKAARELWGDQGWAGVSMRGVCSLARLNDRYFYESFADVESLLLAVYDQGLEELVGRMGQSIASAPAQPEQLVGAAVATFVHALASDPRAARIGLAEPAGSPALEQRRRDTYHVFADIGIGAARAHLPNRTIDEAVLRMDALFALGGLGELVLTWLTGSLPVTEDELVEHITKAVLAIGAPHLRNPEATG